MRRQAAGRVERIAVLAAIAVCCCARLALAAPQPKPESKRINPVEVMQGLAGIQESQGALSTSLSEIRTLVGELRQDLSALRDDLRQLRELAQSDIEHNKEMREEVRGLYVESSGVKGDIAQAGKQVEVLAQELGSFRLSSGIIIAVVIVLQLVLIGLTFRTRSGL